MAEPNSQNEKKKPVEPWRVQRIEQPVPGHIDEPAMLSPWILISVVLLLAIGGCAVLFFSNSGAFSGTTAPERTPTRDTLRPTGVPATPTATSPTAPPTAPPTLSATRYTVKKGDTLSSIAQRFKVSVEAIRAANNLSGDTIREGDIIIIPLPTPTPVNSPKVTPTPLAFGTPTLIAFIPTATPLISLTPTATPGFIVYTVKSGDTLIQIAATFSTTVQSIMDINQLVGANIRAGQALTVPIGSWTPVFTPTPYTIPTATPTIDFIYTAPLLNYPPEGKEFANSDNVQLSWLSVAALKGGENYVVNLKLTCDDKEYRFSSSPTQGTAYQLVNKAPCAPTSRVTVAWYVVVVRQSGCPGKPNPNQPCALSPISEIRTFVWNP